VTVLTQRMREELVRRNYAASTIRTYLMAIEEFRRHAQKRLDHLGPDDIRHYQVALLEDKKLAVGTVALRISALRFFYLKVLKKYALRYELPYPKNPKWARRLPTILTPEEMTRLIDSAKNLFHYAMLLTMYSCGLRRSELCRLKVSDIDSQRMVVRVERGKGGVDREIPLNQKLLETLRAHWRWLRPKTYITKHVPPTLFDTALPAICSKRAQISGPSRSSWATGTSRPLRVICTSRPSSYEPR